MPAGNIKWEYQKRCTHNQWNFLDGAFCEKSYWRSAVNFFHEKLHLRYFTGFWICLWSSPDMVIDNKTEQLFFKFLSATFFINFLFPIAHQDTRGNKINFLKLSKKTPRKLFSYEHPLKKYHVLSKEETHEGAQRSTINSAHSTFCQNLLENHEEIKFKIILKNIRVHILVWLDKESRYR